RVCDSIVGELESEEYRDQELDFSYEIMGNVAYTVCSHCMGELHLGREIKYFH
ncbi:MAG: hypothetical protein GX351_00220, partial [Peptococcaceae bacterium]|nr:hypothetical protein [Peptococcaceae bacterium]